MEPAIAISGLHKTFGMVSVLEGIDLQVERGSILALLGPNGAGKTTLVRILATLLQPDSGTAMIEGRDVVREAGTVRRLIGLTGQYASVDELLTGEENLVMIGQLLQLGGKESRQRAKALLEQFDLADAARRRIATYSGGMRRRLDLAASLIGRPPVLFLDEPTTGLDLPSRLGLWEVIRGMAKDGITILLTTQYLEEADVLADRIAVLHQGAIVRYGTPRGLKQQVGQERLTLQFGSVSDLDQAGAVVARLDPHLLSGETSLSLPLQEPDQLRLVLNLLADAHIPVTNVQLSEPTLDDVFLAITTRRPEEAVR